MNMNRRTFLAMSAAFAAGCSSTPGGFDLSDSNQPRTINAGPSSQYLADGVYPRYRDLGVFIVRQGGKLFAISAICTHRRCKLNAEADKTFYCPCHGSTFDADGRVTEGPARRDLPVFEMSINEKDELLVKIAA